MLLIGLGLNSWFLTVSISEAGVVATVFGFTYAALSFLKSDAKFKKKDLVVGTGCLFFTIIATNSLNMVSLTSSKNVFGLCC